jgi:hypothetical protein
MKDKIAANNRLNDIRAGQTELLKNILLAGLATGSTLYGGSKLLEMLGTPDRPVSKFTKAPVYIPSKDTMPKKEIGNLDKFSSVKAAGLFSWLGDGKETVDLFDASPYTLPLALLAAGGGLYGGYKGTDYLYNILKNKEQSSELSDAEKEQRELLKRRYDLVKMQSEQKAIDSAFERYIKSKEAPKDNVKEAGLGTLGGVGLTLGGLLWAISHNKMRKYMASDNQEKQRYEKLKNKLEHTDLNQVSSGDYISIDREDPNIISKVAFMGTGAASWLGDQAAKQIKSIGGEWLGNRGFDNLEDQGKESFQETLDGAKQGAKDLANDPQGLSGVSQPFINNKEQVMAGVREAAQERVPGMFQNSKPATV